ncbi:hypothetical protein Rhopal_005465-T1 [Rhodotorula paludigena]|uniref:Uncharacterized protein n=1 Tax=Rhodotorula paludigena TaxID=86838 RepID=A0AAV5GIG1_9BASI|nr:hypothetical protein Rhopal_005465-T1 [Rhodotorula paludigena]
MQPGRTKTNEIQAEIRRLESDNGDHTYNLFHVIEDRLYLIRQFRNILSGHFREEDADDLDEAEQEQHEHLENLHAMQADRGEASLGVGRVGPGNYRRASVYAGRRRY